MQLKILTLRNFRSYENQTFTFAPGINGIVGKNGIGKTNLLEALYLLSTGKSFRATKLDELIRFRAPYFYIEATFEKQGKEHTISFGYDRKSKRLIHNGSPLLTLTELLPIFPMTFHLPQDIALVAGAPGDRRRFLNIHLSQTDPDYLKELSRYMAALKQRNALLKAETEDSMDIFEAEMVKAASYIKSARFKCLYEIEQKLPELTDKLTDSFDQFKIAYDPSGPDDFAEALKENRKKEFILGITTIGPHRDDFSISLARHRARNTASEGQKRSLVTALKHLEYSRLSSHISHPPLFAIDDFGAHLDPDRKAAATSLLATFPQIILTLPESSPNLHHIIDL
ncbi:MAG: DNA replication and repair protein RecF [Simkaniaceae bacterium]|nr:DNA replication and repair protein RecF [Simkaniaceae bacterium]